MQHTPVVVVLGHIDHGKTTLLDYIRKSKVTSYEAGSITQSIGAYQIEYNKQKITFIDTPGHEAFSKMRSHGANAADLALLIVAGDEGIKSQTIEAIKHIKQARLPFIVVINKIDKPNVDSNKIKQELAQEGILVEGWGGNISIQEVSSQTGKGINELLELIILTSQVEINKKDEKSTPSGIVIASSITAKQGILITLIVKNGEIKQNDWIKFDTIFGKIRAIRDYKNKIISKATAGDPVLIIGFKKAPVVGELFTIVPDKKTAESSMLVKLNIRLTERAKLKLSSKNKKVIKIIIKANENSALDAVTESLQKLFAPEEKDMEIKIIKSEIGEINTSDIELAKTVKAIILGFATPISPFIKTLSLKRDITTKSFNLIYELIDFVKEIIDKLKNENSALSELGRAEILATFSNTKKGQVIGGRVINGLIKKTNAKIFRDKEIIGQGKITELKQNKQNAIQVEKGKEFGILIQSNIDIEKGDTLIVYS